VEKVVFIIIEHEVFFYETTFSRIVSHVISKKIKLSTVDDLILSPNNGEKGANWLMFNFVVKFRGKTVQNYFSTLFYKNVEKE
jgi:hypothetical protein